MRMYPITVFNDPANIADREVHMPAPGDTLGDWVLRQYGPDGFGVPTLVYVGHVAEDAELDLSDFRNFNRPIDAPVFIVHSPLGTELIVAAIVAVVVAVAVVLLMPIPDLSGNGRQQRKSPNNALSGQTNVARLLDRVPDIFGEVRSYPDLIAPTVTEYIDHVKFQREYMCVGRGYYLLEDFRQGDTLIDDIPGSSYAEFVPGTAPAEVLKTRQSNEVAGQELIAPNEQAYTEVGPAFTARWDSGSAEGTLEAPLTGAWEGFNPGDTVELANIEVNDGGVLNLDGTYTVASVLGVFLVLDNVAAVNPNWGSMTDGVATAILEPAPAVAYVTKPDSPQLRGPYVVPGTTKNEQVWLDITAPKGLAKGKKLNKTVSVDLSFLFEEIDAAGTPLGPSFTYPVTVSDNTRDPRFWTFKVTGADGLQADTRYRVTGERLTDSETARVDYLDEIRWQRLAGIQNVTAPDNSGTTRVVTETRATEQVAAIQERKFNVRATRKVVTWNGSEVVGDIETGAGLVPSRRFADALLHYMLDPQLGARTVGNIDVDELYAVQNKLDAVFDGAKGEFSYTFDDKDTPALEELRLIAQAARSFLYREGAFFGVTRDEAQAIPRGLINRRNKTPDTEQRTVSFNRPLDADGVEIEYNDIEDGNTRVIRFPDDLPPDDENYGQPPAVNPKRVDGAGIRQYAQAWDRLQYEYRRLIYNRVSVEVGTTRDGLLYPLNSRLHVVDGTRLAELESDGEVLDVQGLRVLTSQECIFRPGETYTVILRDHEGQAVAPIEVVPLVDSNYGFELTRDPGFDILRRGDFDYQRGTLYSFGPDGNELASAYLLQRKTPDEGGDVKLELINYAAEYYAADDREPPAKVEL